MKYFSAFSGIEAASVAWEPLGWTPVGFSEVDPFANAVLAHRFPEVTNYGDITQHDGWNIEQPDLIIGGSPCQAFSIAGLRGGLADARGNLALLFLRLVAAHRPRWVVWENVPGVLSSGGGRDFGAILGALGELGYGYAWRVCDAQYWHLAQRRERVFLVGHLGDPRCAAAVLLESSRSGGNPREERPSSEVDATGAAGGAHGAGRGYRMLGFGHYADDDRASALKRRDYKDATDLVVTPTGAVRRLTPREGERLMGFPDDWTLVPWRGKMAPDGVRYMAVGNSFPVPVVRWIGERIAAVDALMRGA